MRGFSVAILICVFFCVELSAQNWDFQRPERNRKVYYDLEDASKIPLRVLNLDLSKQGLEETPEEVKQFRNLSYLNLSGNKLSALPESIKQLSRLDELDLSYMPTLKAAGLFEHVKSLAKLKILNLEHGEFVILPHEVSELKGLEEINLQHNRFPAFPNHLTELPNLRSINLGHNKLTKLDYDIYRLQNLMEIDLSFNEKLDYDDAVFTLSFIFGLRNLSLRGLREVPESLNKVQQINFLDLSEGTFDRIPIKLNDLTSLEHLRVNNCKNIQVKELLPKFAGLTQLQKLEIQHNKVYLFPKGIGKFHNLKELTIGGPLLKYGPVDLKRLTKLREFAVVGSPLLEVDDLLAKLSDLPKLKILRLKLCDFKNFPLKITKFRNLELLDLSGNALTYIPSTITDMVNLKTLDLRGNQLNDFEVEVLRGALPQCKILYSPKPASRTFIRNIRPPIQNVDIPVATYKIHGHSATSLQHVTGTQIKIPKDAFLDGGGKVISGQIEIKYREFVNPLDIFLGGIPMTIDSFGQRYDLKSEIVLELKAFYRGRMLYPNPAAPISVEMLTESDEVYEVHHYDVKNGKWVRAGKDQILGKEKSPVVGGYDPFAGGFMNPSIPVLPTAPAKPAVEEIDVSFYLNKKQKIITFGGKHANSPATRNSGWSAKFLRELSAIEGFSWRYDGRDWKTDSKLLDTLAHVDEYLKEAERDTKILDDFCLSYGELGAKKTTDIFLTQNENRQFVLNFIRAVDTVSLPVMVNAESDAFDSESFEKYQANRDIRLKEWGKVDDLYRANLKKYEEAVDEYRVELSRFASDMGPAGGMKAVQPEKTRRRLKITNFGITSINKMQIRGGQKLMAQYVDDEGTVHHAQEVYVLDETNNKVIQNSGHQLDFDPRAKNTIIALLHNGDLGVINSGTFRRIPKSLQKGQTLLELEVLPKESISIQRLKVVLSFN